MFSIPTDGVSFVTNLFHERTGLQFSICLIKGNDALNRAA